MRMQFRIDSVFSVHLIYIILPWKMIHTYTSRCYLLSSKKEKRNGKEKREKVCPQCMLVDLQSVPKVDTVLNRHEFQCHMKPNRNENHNAVVRLSRIIPSFFLSFFVAVVRIFVRLNGMFWLNDGT